MVQIRVSADVEKLTRHLRDIERKQIPFAVATGLTAVAKHAQTAVTAQLPSIFDRPTPFTMRAIGIEAARKNDLTATIFVRPLQARYLELEETGGFRSAHTGKTLPEPVGIPTNAYGNIARRKIAQLAARPAYFVASVNGVRGLFQRPKKPGQPLKLMARFVAGWAIKPKFEFVTRVTADVRRTLPSELAKALEKALTSAR